MPERKPSKVTEYWRDIQSHIEQEVGFLLEQGWVLTTTEVTAIANKLGIPQKVS